MPCANSADLVPDFGLAACVPLCELFLASDSQTNTKVQWTVLPGMAHLRVVQYLQQRAFPKTSSGFSSMRVRIGMDSVRSASTFPSSASANTPVLALQMPLAVGAGA